MSTGIFISIEGTEGGGKTTQARRLADRLRIEGWDVVELREPGGTSIGEEIRRLLKRSDPHQTMMPETELLLIAASRAQLVRERIRPALESGRLVLCDRYIDSTTAYQGFGRQLDPKDVQTAIDIATGETRPDLTLILHVPVHVSEQRRQLRQDQHGSPGDRFEEADVEFFQRVDRGFRAIADANPDRVVTIDATGPIEEVAKEIWRHVEGRLPGTRSTPLIRG